MFTSDRQFEDEVRRLARLLWPDAAFGGASLDDGRERDGVFESEDFVNIIECTTSRGTGKAEEDASRIAKMIRSYEVKRPHKHIMGWFVTLHEPTADQRKVVEGKKERMVALSFDQLRSRLVDARSYLTLRTKYPYGSVRDPHTGTAQTDLDYVPLEMLDRDGGFHSIDSLTQALGAGGRAVLLGDYGAGKSSTLRELFLRTSKRFWDSKSLLFPILLNLRDHHGQTDPTEALERHARSVGFAHPSHLVRAWRAGFGILMLDGFDEIASSGWSGKTRRLRDLRYRSMQLIRHFVKESPSACGIIIAGREHFFDNPSELAESLGINPSFRRVTLSEFTQDQVTDYLRRSGWKEAVPDWLPSRPLLLGYLASRGLLEATLSVKHGSSPAAGWDGLIGRVCERESEIEAGIDSGTVRHLIEHIASSARHSPDGLGPVSPALIIDAFEKICGYPPDDRGMVLLQRLPGLGGHSSEDGARVFVDADFAVAAAAGDVVRAIENPYGTDIHSAAWQSTLPPLGSELVAYRCHSLDIPPAKISASLARIAEDEDDGTLAADIFLALQQVGAQYDGPKTYIRGAMVSYLPLSRSAGSCGAIEFQDCVILECEMETELDESSLPRFVRCYFTKILGRTSEGELPRTCFSDCDFETFEDAAQTADAILSLPIPLGARVLLTVLKKLFAQAGRGRKESALFRGLDHKSREIVPSVLELVRSEGFALRARLGDQNIWLPARENDARRRALQMLASPAASTDPLLGAAGRL